MVRDSSKKVLKESSRVFENEPILSKVAEASVEVSPVRFRSEFPTLEEVKVMKLRVKE